jgi:hypothetical protein
LFILLCRWFDLASLHFWMERHVRCRGALAGQSVRRMTDTVRCSAIAAPMFSLSSKISTYFSARV